jgi:GTPase SAR1 family protein
MNPLRPAHDELAERLRRPQRIGLFGRRGVGKTTLLTMLYREAVSGRLADIRLAAGDARTASYLADRIVQIENGQALPATLAETELRLHLYHKGRRVELLFKDYQGEHVALGRDEPIRAFMRDCDALWLCLDHDADASAPDRLRAQQEVEQLVEDYLAVQQPGEPRRPMEVVLTKADLHEHPAAIAEQHFGIALHALASHAPAKRVLPVSSLGGAMSPGAFSPKPSGLAELLIWLVDALRVQDEARLAILRERASNNLRLLDRCVATYTRRYPDTSFGVEQRHHLAVLRKRRSRRQAVLMAAFAVTALLGLTGYDALGAHRARQFAAENAADPIAVRDNWERFRRWHPMRRLLQPAAARAEDEELVALDHQIADRRFAERFAELSRRCADPDADPEETWEKYRSLREEFPDRDPDVELQQARESARRRRDEARERSARSALADLQHAESQADLAALIAQADRFLREHADTTAAEEVSSRRASYVRRLDEHDIEAARDYSAREPLNFFSRRQRYQAYLDRHPQGLFATEASAAVESIAAEWDRHDYRAVRDYFRAHAGDIKEVEARGRSYLAAHARGRFRTPIVESIRWAERVVEPREYHVVLKSGRFDRKVAWFFSRGPDLSVEIEVNGVRHGPSNIVRNRYDPTWDYEFPRRITWKLGDQVRIRVFDHDYYKRSVLHLVSDESDPLAMWMLSGEVVSDNNSLTFESDFRLPDLPPAE